MMAADLSYAQSGADVVKTRAVLPVTRWTRRRSALLQGPCREIQRRQGGGSKLVAKLKEAKAHPKTAASDSELEAAVAYILSVK